jgi:hypothetical protein
MRYAFSRCPASFELLRVKRIPRSSGHCWSVHVSDNKLRHMRIAAWKVKFRTYYCLSTLWQLLLQRRRFCFLQCWWSRRPALQEVFAVWHMLVLGVLIERAPHCHQRPLYASSKLFAGILRQRKSASAGIMSAMMLSFQHFYPRNLSPEKYTRIYSQSCRSSHIFALPIPLIASQASRSSSSLPDDLLPVNAQCCRMTAELAEAL